jgi:SNF2 family DNA or RNA helicase
MPAHLEELNLPTLNSNISLFYQNIFARVLTLKRPAHELKKLNQTRASSAVDLNPHQIDAALFAFNCPLSRGAILCDEVGLGKTIEAGLITSQLWAEGKRKLIIVVPASLRKQWQNELFEKYIKKSII